VLSVYLQGAFGFLLDKKKIFLAKSLFFGILKIEEIGFILQRKAGQFFAWLCMNLIKRKE